MKGAMNIIWHWIASLGHVGVYSRKHTIMRMMKTMLRYIITLQLHLLMHTAISVCGITEQIRLLIICQKLSMGHRSDDLQGTEVLKSSTSISWAGIIPLIKKTYRLPVSGICTNLHSALFTPSEACELAWLVSLVFWLGPKRDICFLLIYDGRRQQSCRRFQPYGSTILISLKRSFVGVIWSPTWEWGQELRNSSVHVIKVLVMKVIISS